MFDDEFQGLTVLEYLVAHGSERVIDDIREHAYQISVSFFLLVKFVTLMRLPTCGIWGKQLSIVFIFSLPRHCPIFNISTPVGETREATSERNLRALWFLLMIRREFRKFAKRQLLIGTSKYDSLQLVLLQSYPSLLLQVMYIVLPQVTTMYSKLPTSHFPPPSLSPPPMRCCQMAA